jgi:hypothetical protein
LSVFREDGALQSEGNDVDVIDQQNTVETVAFAGRISLMQKLRTRVIIFDVVHMKYQGTFAGRDQYQLKFFA